MISPDKFREDTPGCATRLHFNNAGSSLMPRAVISAIQEYINLEAEIGGYEAADHQAEQLARFYPAIGKLIGSPPENIAYTSSATNSFARALSSIPLQAGDVVIIAQEDYISNQFAFLSMEKRFGIRLIRARSVAGGGVDVDEVRELIKIHSPKLISLSHVPSNTGLIQPAEEIGELCADNDILYLLDACQSVGQLPVDVSNLKCDFLCATMRKFLRGPRGAGFLYVSPKVLRKQLEPLFIDLRGAAWKEADHYEARKDARRFEDSEFPYALVLGSAIVGEYATEVGIHNIMERNRYLCEKVREGIRQVPMTRLLDEGQELSSIITVAIHNNDPVTFLRALREKNINVSISYRNFALPDFDRKKEDWALRISPHYYNTEEEVSVLIEAIRRLV